MYSSRDISILANCTICPRNCSVDRFAGGSGWCGMDARLNIASVCIHKGEEPVISGPLGICNIFFTGCNMKCVFCQNHEISRRAKISRNNEQTIGEIINEIRKILNQGINTVGFVSPSHMTVQMKAIITEMHLQGMKPVIVYNTNGYDNVETLRDLESLIDVYLPDFKYVSPDLASHLSGAGDYPAVAIKALKEMYYQKGSSLRLDDSGTAENGMLIRHLVLPGHVEESKMVLRTIAEELSTGVHLSLMSQYYPAYKAVDMPPLDRSLYAEEYAAVVEEMNLLGFRNGYLQEISSNSTYRPDFSAEHPFEG